MKIAVVAFPRLDDLARGRIESFRERHDPQARRIALHFTLVFPCEAEAADVGRGIGCVAHSTPPIAFSIRRAAVVPDAFGAHSNIFLVPDEGSVEIVALHDRLYAGPLRRHLRADIPFVPHVTIGATSNPSEAAVLAREFDFGSGPMTGTLAEIDVVDVGSHLVRAVMTCALGER